MLMNDALEIMEHIGEAAAAAKENDDLDVEAARHFWASQSNEQQYDTYDINDNQHTQDWGHEQDFQFDDESEYGDDMPF